jgi:serine phosphatase RsbU (regulator of sigma subunit)
MPVGLVPSTPFALSHRDLRAGDRIVLYTDGVTEAQNHKGEFFGRARLREAVRAGADADCATLHESILRAILDFTAGAEQADDSTLVVVEYRGNHF